MCDLCPTCGQVLPWKREGKKTSKMLSDDLSKAKRAVERLYAVIAAPRSILGAGLVTEHWSEKETGIFIEACQLEIERLTVAQSDHKLLWTIYRRGNNKGLLAYS